MLADSTVHATVARATFSRHRAFFPIMSVVLIVFVYLGFAPTYYRRPVSAGPIVAYLHVHGAAMTAWYLLLLLQTTLIAVRRRSVHRRLGFAGAAIAAIIVMLNPLVALWSVANAPPDQPVELTALIVVGDLLAMATFAVLVTLAIVWRNRPETHSRMLMLASISVAGPAFGRLSLHLMDTPFPGVIALMSMPLLVVAHDRIVSGRVHRASAWGAAAIVGSLAVSIAIANSAMGAAIVRWLE